MGMMTEFIKKVLKCKKRLDEKFELTFNWYKNYVKNENINFRF